MSIFSALIKLQAVLAIYLFVCVSPLLILTAIVSKTIKGVYRFCVKPQKSVAGEVALVSGAGNGLGRAIALELAKLGCHIAVADIDLHGAEETVKQINNISTVRAKAYKVNVASYNEVVELNSELVKDLGPVTVLVNNAGILLLSNSLDPNPLEVQRMIDVNLTSHFWTKSVFLPTMKQLRKGHIVTISSLAGIIPLAYNTTYTATKFGATGHMKALRMELALERQSSIYVSTVMPSFLKTNKEISEIAQNVNFNRLYPLISGEDAARQIVQGMLRGEREIMLPGIVGLLNRVLVLLPVSWQESIILLISSGSFRKFYDLRA